MALLLSVALAVYAWAIAARVGAWSHPAIIFALFWSILAFVAGVTSPGIQLDAWAALYIFGAVVALGLPVFAMAWAGAVDAARARRGHVERLPLLLPFIVLQIVAIVCVPLNVMAQGFSLLDVVTDPIRFAGDYTGQRYLGNIEPNLFSRVGPLANYIGVPLGGVLIASNPKWRRNLTIITLAFIPALLALFVYGDKGTLFLCIAYFYGGLIVGWVSTGTTSLVTRRASIAMALAAAALVPLIFAALVIKAFGAWQWENNQVMISVVLYYLRSYTIASLFAFSDWFADRETGPLAWGFWTFLAIGKHVQPSVIIPEGTYADYFEIPGVMKTNIFTMFRGLVVDFGITGSLVFMAGFGTVASLAYRRILANATAPISQALIVAFAGFTYSSYLISLGTWTSPYVAALAFAVVMATMRLPVPRRARAAIEAQQTSPASPRPATASTSTGRYPA